MNKTIILTESQFSSLNEDHLKVVDNIDEIIKWIDKMWNSPDDMWWIKIDQRKKDFRNFNKRNNSKRPQKWWSRVNRQDGTERENHVGYVIIRGRTKEDCVNSLKNSVVHLHPWAAKEVGVTSVRSNGNGEAIRIVCNHFFARAYITINQRSMQQTIDKARDDKKSGLFKGRSFHHRAGQSRTGVDSSGFNWSVNRKYGLIDCDVDNIQAQNELENYLDKNNVEILMKRQSHDGMHYVISVEDAKRLNFDFMKKYDSNNVASDPNVLFKPDANIIVYSPVG